MPDAVQIFVAALAMLVASTVASTVGFGIGISATPILLLVLDPQTAVVMLNTVGVIPFALVLMQTRRHLPLREVVPIGLAGLLGAPVGVYVLSAVSPGAMRVAIAALILTLAIPMATEGRWSVSRPRVLVSPLGFVVAGLIAASGIGGPLMVLFMLDPDRSRQAVRASLSFYFLLIMAAGVVGYGVAGLFTPATIALVLIAVVPVLVGFGLSRLLLQRLDERSFRLGVIAIIVLASLSVLTRELVRLA